MTAAVIPFPVSGEPAILVDETPFGGWEVEPYCCPVLIGRGRLFATFTDAFAYAETLEAKSGAAIAILCDVPSAQGGAT